MGGSGRKEKEFPFLFASSFTLALLRHVWSDRRIWYAEGHREPKRLGRYTCRDIPSIFQHGKSQFEWSQPKGEVPQYAS